MGLLDRLRGRGTGGPDPVIVLDLDARRGQLQELEQALDALARLMRDREDLMVNPGWRAKITEYDLVASEAMQLRRGTPTRDAIVDIAFEVRPAVKGPEQSGMEEIIAAQQHALAIADQLGGLLPGERQ